MTTWTPDLEATHQPLYAALSNAIARDIQEGRLKTGQRLPTHRELAKRLGVTVGTVSRGYAEATRRGLIGGEVGRGTFVRAPATELAVDTLPDGVVDLSLNHPPPLGPLGEELLRSKLEALTAEASLGAYLDYAPEKGSAAHRQAGAEWVARAGVTVPADQILIASGSQHALTALLTALLKPGDIVLTERLTYPGLRALGRLLGIRLRGIHVDEHGIQIEALEAALAQAGQAPVRALYTIPTLQNPTGSVLPEARRQAIAEIASKHDLLLIEDDVHGLLVDAPAPVAQRAPDSSFYISSTAKTLAPGFRVAFLSAPTPYIPTLAASLRTTTWMTSQLMVELVARLIADGSADRLVAERRRQASERRQLFDEYFPGRAENTPTTSHHLWLELPEPWRSERFAEETRQGGVAVTPAQSFLVGGAAPSAVRVCLGAAKSCGELERGLQALTAVLEAGPLDPLIV